MALNPAGDHAGIFRDPNRGFSPGSCTDRNFRSALKSAKKQPRQRPVSYTHLQVRKVGSSSASLASATAIFSCEALVLGSIATRITGSGNSIDSRITGCPSSQRVSPVSYTHLATTCSFPPIKKLPIPKIWEVSDFGYRAAKARICSAGAVSSQGSARSSRPIWP